MKLKYTTRFLPTVTGPQHLGHLFMALVNATEAHNSGGCFVLRIDDTEDFWNYKLGQKLVDQFTDEYLEQLNRFMKIDTFERQSTMPKIEDIIDHPLVKNASKQKWQYDQSAEWPADPDMCLYPFAPRFTIEKVVWDFYDRVNWLIRGEDLMVEANLYDYFVDQIGLPRMRHTYWRRLRTAQNKELLNQGLSKTFGTYTLGKQIDKLGIDGVLYYLKDACLINPEGEFVIENLKLTPLITAGFEP